MPITGNQILSALVFVTTRFSEVFVTSLSNRYYSRTSTGTVHSYRYKGTTWYKFAFIPEYWEYGSFQYKGVRVYLTTGQQAKYQNDFTPTAVAPYLELSFDDFEEKTDEVIGIKRRTQCSHLIQHAAQRLAIATTVQCMSSITKLNFKVPADLQTLIFHDVFTNKTRKFSKADKPAR